MDKRPSIPEGSGQCTTSAERKSNLGKHWGRVYQPKKDVSMD